MKKEFIADNELIVRFKSGNESGACDLFNRYYKKVYSYIYIITKDRDLAQDLCQDTFFKVFNIIKSKSYKEEGKFQQWIMKVAHNVVIDYYRKSKKMTMVYDCEENGVFNKIKLYDESYEDRIIKEQSLEQVKNLLEYLPLEQKEIIQMRHYNNLSFKEIADQTNVSINTALGRMRYAIINLRKIVNENNIYLSL
ncbi:MAG: hypothetical protein A2X12_02895 [Bacteroidetes bacterium GWE2_29_8]|nr:MAG: hypothetical protein A2X12_02895 [Bacteroidetes bacterium GWE2_29_8]OFY24854.1 MAG: hypothetical protein A2X02_03920 [Bacteroidetes bacterium GWF2_29_10]